jgi:hypothetical protein
MGSPIRAETDVYRRVVYRTGIYNPRRNNYQDTLVAGGRNEMRGKLGMKIE